MASNRVRAVPDDVAMEGGVVSAEVSVTQGLSTFFEMILEMATNIVKNGAMVGGKEGEKAMIIGMASVATTKVRW